MLSKHRSTASRGFTIIELVVVMAIFGLLAALTAPNLASWMQNSRVRTTADIVLNGLRVAQSEAIKQNRLIAFRLTNANPTATATPPAPVAAGALANYWYAATVPWSAAPAANANAYAVVASGINSPDAAQVTVQEASATIGTLCFTPYGRLTGTTSDTTGNVPTCDLPLNSPPKVTFRVMPTAVSANSHELDVTVSPGGQIRMCDPQKPALPASPDGC
jgi:type IV fimbrial biogenesis protein FimT